VPRLQVGGQVPPQYLAHSAFTLAQQAPNERPGGWLGTLGDIAQIAGPIIQTAVSIREAQKQRDWEERMSSTAHQREVKDMIAAGINPLVRQGSGASTPGGSMPTVQDPFSGLMLVAQMRQLEAQTRNTDAQTRAIDQETGFKKERFPGELKKLGYDTDISELSALERRKMLPNVLRRAKADIDQATSSAKALKARAMLDEAARTGALNQQQLEELLGKSSPAIRLFFELMRSMR